MAPVAGADYDVATADDDVLDGCDEDGLYYYYHGCADNDSGGNYDDDCYSCSDCVEDGVPRV